MRLAVFNGSPKIGAGNTDVLVSKFVNGFAETNGNAPNVYKLSQFSQMGEAVAKYLESDWVIFAFPMYNFSIPTALLEFFGRLDSVKNSHSEKNIGFIVQYGYLEAAHARPLERYLEYLARLLRCNYIGTVIRGGADSLATRPKFRPNVQICLGIENIGRHFGRTQQFDRAMLQKFSQPEDQTQVGKVRKLLMRLLVRKINKKYWLKKLQANGVSLEQSFARPYLEQ